MDKKEYNDILIEVIHRLINKDGIELKNIPDQYKTYSLCLEAVKQNGLAIQYVPLEIFHKRRELNETAIINNPMALEFILEEDKMNDICMMAISIQLSKSIRKRYMMKLYNSELYNLVTFTPDKYKNIYFYFDLLKYCPLIIKLVPEDIINKRLCLEALRYNGKMFRYLPPLYKVDIDICTEAINSIIIKSD